MISKSFQIWLSFQVLSAKSVMLFNFGANLRWPFDAKIKGKGTIKAGNKRFHFKTMRRFHGALLLLQHNFCFQAGEKSKALTQLGDVKVYHHRHCHRRHHCYYYHPHHHHLLLTELALVSDPCNVSPSGSRRRCRIPHLFGNVHLFCH